MKFVKVLTAVAVSAVLATGVSANAKTSTIAYGGTAVNQPYVGVKVGRVSDSFDKTSSFDYTGYGVYGGYNFDQNFGVEADFIGTDKKNGGKAQAYGAYGTYRYNFENSPFYAKAKAGVSKVDAKQDYAAIVGNTIVTQTAEASDTTFAYGLGAGYQTGNLGVEATFSRPHKSIDVVTIGAHLAF